MQQCKKEKLQLSRTLPMVSAVRFVRSMSWTRSAIPCAWKVCRYYL